MFDNYQFDVADSQAQHFRTNLARLTEIQTELKSLAEARDLILKELIALRAILEGYRQEGTAVRVQAMELLQRLRTHAEEERPSRRPLTSEEKGLIHDLNATQLQLERVVDMTERRLKVAQFEADSLAQMLEDLEDQVADLVADLELGEDGIIHERN